MNLIEQAAVLRIQLKCVERRLRTIVRTAGGVIHSVVDMPVKIKTTNYVYSKAAITLKSSFRSMSINTRLGFPDKKGVYFPELDPLDFYEVGIIQGDWKLLMREFKDADAFIQAILDGAKVTK